MLAYLLLESGTYVSFSMPAHSLPTADQQTVPVRILSPSETCRTPTEAGTNFCWAEWTQRASALNRFCFCRGREDLKPGAFGWQSSILTTRLPSPLWCYRWMLSCLESSHEDISSSRPNRRHKGRSGERCLFNGSCSVISQTTDSTQPLRDLTKDQSPSKSLAYFYETSCKPYIHMLL